MRTIVARRLSPLVAAGRAFAADRGGNFAALFGLSSLVLISAAGMALDYSRLSSAKVRLNQAVDAAVLSTTRNITLGTITEDEAEEVVTAYVLANIDEGELAGEPVRIDKVVIDAAAKTLQVEASIRVPMTLTKLISASERVVSTDAKAQFSNTQIEVAMALDITGSMATWIPASGETRMQGLKKAATKAIDLMFAAPGADERVRIGLVPYAATVDASPVIDEINYTGSSNGCVYERTGPKRYERDFASPLHPVGGTKDCPGAEILPMTDDAALLKSRINAFGTGGCTAGHIAIAWSYYMLAPEWNSAWPAGSDAGPFAPGTRKYAIIMTDGIFNTHPSSGKWCNTPGQAQSNLYARKLCDSMKDDGIKVYTIAFAAPAKAAALMKDCANPDTAESTFFFNATDSDQLEDAFAAIAEDITGLALIN